MGELRMVGLYVKPSPCGFTGKGRVFDPAGISPALTTGGGAT